LGRSGFTFEEDPGFPQRRSQIGVGEAEAIAVSGQARGRPRQANVKVAGELQKDEVAVDRGGMDVRRQPISGA